MENDTAARAAEWDLFVGFSGNGAPLVFLHGQFGTYEIVRRLISDLDRSHTLITPDVRGRGQSICPDPTLHTWDQYAADVISTLDELQMDQASIGGVSLGAGVALATAIRFPERVSSLVLHSSVYAGEETGWLPSQKELQARVLETAKQVAERGFEALEDEPPAALAKWKRHDEKSIAAALLGLGWSQPFQSKDDLQGITCPTLLIGGSDALHPAEVSEMYLTTIAGARSPDAIPIDSESTTAAIREFLSKARS
jgi:3-oxoadipate enol-lactonase